MIPRSSWLVARRAVSRGVLILLVAASPACSSEDPADNGSDAGGASGEDSAGLRMCCELGATCHVTGETTDETLEECHILAHQNDANACRDNYERCMSACQGANDDPVEHSCE